jgi:predicted DNA binding CopG/RHH family protein
MGGEVMPLIVVTWPNNTFSIFHIFKGFTIYDLFEAIDEEANPFDAKTIHKVIPDPFVSFRVESDVSESGIKVRMADGYGRLKKLSLDGFDYQEYINHRLKQYGIDKPVEGQ